MRGAAHLVYALFMPVRFRLVRYFARRVLELDLVFAAFAGVGSSALIAAFAGEMSRRVWKAGLLAFGLTGCTAGYAFALIVYHWYRAREQHLFKTHGLSTPALVVTSYLIDSVPFAGAIVLAALYGG